jgi:hypothetical protein
MGLELLAAIVSAVAFWGMAHLVWRLTGRRLPRWIMPASAAIGLIGFTIWSEYSWYGRVSSELPAGVEVVWSETRANGLRPWTHVFPLTTRFIALDTRAVAAHPANAALRLAPVYDIARWTPTRDGMMVFDCAAGRQILLTDQVTIDDQGNLSGADWIEPGPEDAFQKQACGKD